MPPAKHTKHVQATVADQPGSQVITVGQSQTTARLLRQVRDDPLDPRHITWESFVKLMVLSNDARVQMAIGIFCCTVGVYARGEPTRQHHLSQGCIQQTRLACSRLIHNLCNAYASSAASRCLCNSERKSALSGMVNDVSCISLSWCPTSARLEHTCHAQAVTEKPSRDVSDHKTVSAVDAGWCALGFRNSLKSLVSAAIHTEEIAYLEAQQIGTAQRRTHQRTVPTDSNGCFEHLKRSAESLAPIQHQQQCCQPWKQSSIVWLLAMSWGSQRQQLKSTDCMRARCYFCSKATESKLFVRCMMMTWWNIRVEMLLLIGQGNHMTYARPYLHF